MPVNKLKIEGRYRYFNEIERKAGEHPNASWILDSKKNDVIVWCSNDYLGMSQNKLVINSMIDAVKKESDDPGDVLVEIPPGRYLMAEKTAYLKINEKLTGLLVHRIGENYKVVLVNDKLVIL